MTNPSTGGGADNQRPERPFVYLASRSPRRRDLLASVGIDCELLLDPDEERAEALEQVLPGEAPTPYVRRVVLAKAAAATQRLVDRATPVVVADTTVAIGGSILGKPADDDEARRMLGRLAGRVHRVITGVAVIDPRPAVPRVLHRLQVSRVRFRRLDAATIDRYVASGEPHGKAGGYGIQGRAAAFVQGIEGSHSGIVGLPLFETCALLRKAGLHGV